MSVQGPEGMIFADKYRIVKLIAKGGMANVYKAKCHRLNRLVAIKILKSDLAEDAEFRRRFRDRCLYRRRAAGWSRQNVPRPARRSD